MLPPIGRAQRSAATITVVLRNQGLPRMALPPQDCAGLYARGGYLVLGRHHLFPTFENRGSVSSGHQLEI
jgi:hypothetical protein